MAAFLDNGRARAHRTATLTRHPSEDSQIGPASATWPRRAVIGLWLLAFVIGGGALAINWDSLMTRLARPPAGGVASGQAWR
jgi:hypothetical protein